MGPQTDYELLQNTEHSPKSEASHSPKSNKIPKYSSTSNLLSYKNHPALISSSRHRYSLDVDATTYNDEFERLSLSQSPIIPEHGGEHGTGLSGLRRIRQQPSFRDGESMIMSPVSRSVSLSAASPIISRQPSMTGITTVPPSPALNAIEDLTRFPSESLHSFSFTHQSEDSLHSRQNVLKRSMDFMRDRLGWSASNPGLAAAQARLSGNQEVQSVMDLLSRANLIGEDAHIAHGLGAPAPVTGPADVTGNVFERSFGAPRAESPDNMMKNEDKTKLEKPLHPKLGDLQDIDKAMNSLTSLTESKTELKGDTTLDSLSKALADDPVSQEATPSQSRARLKRTLTNTDELTLESKLVETMAQPYTIEATSSDAQIRRHSAIPPIKISPSLLPSMGPPTTPGHGHHQHQRWSPIKQAIFTTEVNAPWTITSANDLACLIFGVTNHEIRKLGILEVVKEERRKWLEDKLRDPQAGSSIKGSRNTQSQRNSPNHTTSLNVGNGITAKLLSKPPSRHVSAAAKRRRAQTDDGVGSTAGGNSKSGKGGPNHAPSRSRGVLLCGDVVPIRRRNGSLGSASVWVKEKKGSLIWVLEEIVEDVCVVTLDEVGCVMKAEGAVTQIWATDRLRRGMDIQRLIPAIPKMKGTNTGALDYDEILETRTYTAKTSTDMNVPITLSISSPDESGLPRLTVSSFPHIAGIMVLNSQSLVVQSSNTVFCSALFGQERPEGLHVNDILPDFDKLLQLLTEDDKVGLVDGIVIPEHSFRRARALLSMRDGGMQDAAAMMFMRPIGLSAQHRDGSEIMVDVQMRVVKSETRTFVDEEVIEEADEVDVEHGLGIQLPTTEVVYALWITYSRNLHASMDSVGSNGPKSGTSTSSGIPYQHPAPSPAPAPSDISPTSQSPPPSLLSQKLRAASNTPSEPKRSTASGSSLPSSKSNSVASSSTVSIQTSEAQQPTPTDASPPKKKTINDYVVLEEMGQGAYGQVKLCRSKRSGKKSVIKYVTKKRILVDTWTRDRRLGTVPLEIHVLDYLRREDLHLKHPNIVEMTDFFEDDVNYYIEMKPHGLPGMDLFDYIEIRGNMDEAEARGIFVQVAEAVAHLHIKAKVVHRDIKDENVILDGDKNVKLIDFGSAAYIKNGPFDVFVGTIDYAAPEVLAGMSYRGKEQDVWALGILLYTIIYKENPFYSIDEIMDHDLRVPYVMSEASIDLVRRMLDRDVDRRLSIAEVLGHRWCRGVGAEEEEGGEDGGAADVAVTD